MNDTTIAKLTACVRLGRKMRDAQIAYFKSRSQADLVAAKEIEAKFDTALQHVLPVESAETRTELPS